MSAPDRTRSVHNRGLRLAWHEWGPPGRPLALCLHGFLDHGRSFAPVGAACRGALRVVAPDMRGHGESGWVGAGGYYHFYDYFDDLRRIVDALGEEPFLLLGHSMGGSVAVGLAALLPRRVRALVLLEGMGPPFTDLARTRDRLLRWTTALGQPAVDGDLAHRRQARRAMRGLDEAVERLRRFNPRLPPERARAFAESFTEPTAGGGRVWRYDPLHRTPAAKPFFEGEAMALWRGVAAPTLSLFAELGFSPDALDARHGAFARVVVGTVPGVGHNVHHEVPELIAELLLDLDRSGEPRLPPTVRAGPPR